MTTKIKNWLTVTVMAVTISNASCTLDEYNPSGYTMDALSVSVEGYQTILNNVYFLVWKEHCMGMGSLCS